MIRTEPRKRLRAARALLCSAAVVLTAVTFPAPGGAGVAPRTHTVSMRGVKYLPASLVVSVGDTVVWKNDDVVPHTVTARGKSFDSGDLAPGASWSYKATRRGTYSYHCDYHPGMNGRLVVR